MDRFASAARPRGLENATALVPELAFWQGPEQRPPAAEKPNVSPDRPTPVPAGLLARADEALNLPATAMVSLPAAVLARAEAGPAADEAPALANSTASAPRPKRIPRRKARTKAPERPPYHPSAAFCKGWRQWVSVVEVFVQGGNARINEPAYRALRSALLEHCRLPAGTARPAILEQVEALLEPWVTPRRFAATDRETLGGLLERCRRVSRDLGITEGVSWKWLSVLFFLARGAARVLVPGERGKRAGRRGSGVGRRVRALITAYPVPSLAAAATAVILVSIFLLSRLLRK